MTYLGIMDEPPEGFHRMRTLEAQPEGCELWARGSMFSDEFTYCHVRKEQA